MLRTLVLVTAATALWISEILALQVGEHRRRKPMHLCSSSLRLREILRRSYTTLPGRAASSAELNVAAIVRASRKSGDGSKLGGTSKKTPSDPLKAAVSASASLMSASTRAQPRFAQASPLRYLAPPLAQAAQRPKGCEPLHRRRCR